MNKYKVKPFFNGNPSKYIHTKIIHANSIYDARHHAIQWLKKEYDKANKHTRLNSINLYTVSVYRLME